MHDQPPQDQNKAKASDNNNLAADVIRKKLAHLFTNEPAAKEELAEAQAAGRHRSKHQDFMYKLSTSGKSLAEIQTAWHNYYAGLPDNEKHQVWQEFYAEHSKTGQAPSAAAAPAQSKQPSTAPAPKLQGKIKNVAELKKQVLSRVRTGGKLSKKQNFKSLLFGFAMGGVVILILLFSFFNERFIAPFITPSRNVSSSPIIIDPGNIAAGPNPEVIIPKINVEIPVVYDVKTPDEKAIQNALERGVVHFGTTPDPGQQGNVVIVGHSSNNILNKGKYKFAFVLLNKLSEGDTFMLTKDGKRYIYKVYQKKIVKPTDVAVLGTADRPSTATLITCDPPGTSLNRLIVIGEQISPDPNANVASNQPPSPASQPTIVPGNAPSLWQRIKGWFSS